MWLTIWWLKRNYSCIYNVQIAIDSGFENIIYNFTLREGDFKLIENHCLFKSDTIELEYSNMNYLRVRFLVPEDYLEVTVKEMEAHT